MQYRRLSIAAVAMLLPLATLALSPGSAAAGTTTGTWTLYPAQVVSTSYQVTVQQPINPDGSSSWPSKRGVIPVQFSLQSGTTVGPAVFQSLEADHSYSWLSFAPSASLTFSQITTLEAAYTFTTGNCHGGSLRWSITTSAGELYIYYGDLPNFTDCTTNSQTGANMVGMSDLRYDTSHIGGTFYDSYADAVSLIGNLQVTGATLVLDSGWGGDQVVALTSATVNDNTWVPQTGGTSLAPTCTLPPAHIAVTKTSGATPGPIDETTAVQQADTGGVFRTVDCRYMYNLDVSSSLSGVGSYTVQVNIDGVGLAAGQGVFALR